MTLGMLLAAWSTPAWSEIVDVGETLDVTTNSSFPADISGGNPCIPLCYGPLKMDGGTLRIGDPSTGRALSVAATGTTAVPTILARGLISHWYAQSPGTSFRFYGETTVPGAPTGPYPAEGMYLNASPFDSQGMTVVNHGTFTQSGTGELTLMGRTTFVAAAGSTYFFDNDRGMKTTSGLTQLVNQGGSFIKRGSAGTVSAINVPIVHTDGKFEVWDGILVLGAGGTYLNGVFYSNGLGTHPFTSELRFFDTHVFSGSTTTAGGSFEIIAGSTVRAITTPAQPGEWRQQGVLRVTGTLHMDGATLINTGTLTTGFGGRMYGHGNFSNEAGAKFQGGIQAGGYRTDGSLELVNVANRGEFEIPAGHVAEVWNFANHDGVLRVDGDLWNREGGRLVLLGGKLEGGGVINGDAFVGGGPGGAIFTPGHSPGTMTINGNFALDPNGVLELEVESTPGGVLWDKVVVNGSILLNGRVELLVGAGVTVADLQGIQFFACGDGALLCGVNIEYGDNFTWAFPNRPGSTLSFGPQGLGVTSLAPITAVPEPRTYALLLAGLGLVGAVARRGRHREAAGCAG